MSALRRVKRRVPCGCPLRTSCPSNPFFEIPAASTLMSSQNPLPSEDRPNCFLSQEKRKTREMTSTTTPCAMLIAPARSRSNESASSMPMAALHRAAGSRTEPCE